MIARIWRTGVDPARLEDYARFERERSLPMFLEHRGLLDVLFLREARDRAAALTLWEDESVIEALEASPLYRRTVEDFSASGLLLSKQVVEVFEVEGGRLRPQRLVETLGP